MKRTGFGIATALTLVAGLSTQSGQGLQAQAQESQALTLQFSQVDAQSTASYWTADRLAAAQPLRPIPAIAPRTEFERQAQGTPQGAAGSAPSLSVQAARNPLYNPASVKIEAERAAESIVQPNDEGTFHAPYTSSRVTPLSADLKYPYRAAGKLFFTIPGQGDFVCSASVIQRRIVATAGHCVHSGSGGAAGFHANFLFVPAFRDGNAPLKAWRWSFAVVTGTWATGGGAVPNAADYAMLEVADKTFDGVYRRIGEITGWLGWQTLSLERNHTTKLGYPCNIDSCQKMHQELSNNFRNTSPNNVEYGSHSRGGSSGGPWIQNFGSAGVGQTGGLNPGSNRVVGITSYGYVSTDPKVQGASILDNRWVKIFNIACAHRAGNCS
ncbi:MAG: hypothetical protein GEU82_03135 [Luteitalea sp.]|nr:hypothetical protein [Luteitalea sp.]